MSLTTMKNDILRLVPGIHPAIISAEIQNSYKQLASMDWNMLKGVRLVATAAIYSTGLAAITTGGIVTGSGGATFVAGMAGRYMRFHYTDSLFLISTVTPTTTLLLQDWPSVAVTTPEAFTIMQLLYTVPLTVGIVSNVVSYENRLPKKNQAYFNSIDPGRTLNGPPAYWAYGQNDSSGLTQIEIYPPSDQVYPCRVFGKLKVATLGDSDSPVLPEDLVEEHATIRCLLMKIRDELGKAEGTMTGGHWRGVIEAGWGAILKEHKEHYNQILTDYQLEDWAREDFPDRVKDVSTGEGMLGDDYWVARDSIE